MNEPNTFTRIKTFILPLLPFSWRAGLRCARNTFYRILLYVYFCCRYRTLHFSVWTDPSQFQGNNPNDRYHSQRGQDWFLDTFLFRGKTNGFFLDVGANHPTDLSNTLYFEKLGWSGFAFEPQIELAELWKHDRITPCFALLLGDSEKEVEFTKVVTPDWRHALSGVSSSIREAEDVFWGKDIAVKKIIMQQKRLADFLAQHAVTHVDFMSLDVEGHELAVLNGIDFFSVHIHCIVLENDCTLRGDSSLREFLFTQGYRHIARLCGDDVFVR